MKKLIGITLIMVCLGLSSAALAAPYAAKVKITSNTSPLAQMFIKEAKVPDASAVAIPAYPGAEILQTRGYGDMKANGKSYLAYVKLLGPDPVDKVVAWYKEKIPSYFYQKS